MSTSYRAAVQHEEDRANAEHFEPPPWSDHVRPDWRANARIAEFILERKRQGACWYCGVVGCVERHIGKDAGY